MMLIDLTDTTLSDRLIAWYQQPDWFLERRREELLLEEKKLHELARFLKVEIYKK